MDEIELSVHSLRSNGIKANGKREFHVKLSGKKVYALLQLLEDVALHSQVYLDVRTAVMLAEEVRQQTKAQGF
jgi:hypothetical protein